MRAQRFYYPGLGLAMIALIGFGLGGASQSNAAVADTEQEQVLLSSGFKVKSANSPAQRAQIRALPDHQFTMVKQDGKTYYLYPDKKDNRLYSGDQYAYRAYERYFKDKNLRAQGVFVFPLRPENKSDPRNIQVWHGWDPFPAWKATDER
jgi:hypothetical protein